MVKIYFVRSLLFVRCVLLIACARARQRLSAKCTWQKSTLFLLTALCPLRAVDCMCLSTSKTSCLVFMAKIYFFAHCSSSVACCWLHVPEHVKDFLLSVHAKNLLFRSLLFVCCVLLIACARARQRLPAKCTRQKSTFSLTALRLLRAVVCMCQSTSNFFCCVQKYTFFFSLTALRPLRAVDCMCQSTSKTLC